jgi:hypothetical protein
LIYFIILFVCRALRPPNIDKRPFLGLCTTRASSRWPERGRTSAPEELHIGVTQQEAPEELHIGVTQQEAPEEPDIRVTHQEASKEPYVKDEAD